MPINPKAKLAENILDLKSLEQKPTRDGYGLGVVSSRGRKPQCSGALRRFAVTY